jgi:Spy/CpxP family protein refolding chaperone
MMSRRAIVVTAGIVVLGLVTSLGAWAFAGGGGRHVFMKRFVSTMIDEVLDQAQVTPEQRTSVYAARDRVFAAFEEHRRDRQARLEEGLALFEADQPDPAQIAAFRAQREAEHRRLADSISQAITEVQSVLTPEQRKVVTGWIRDHHARHHWH